MAGLREKDGSKLLLCASAEDGWQAEDDSQNLRALWR